MNVSGRFRIMTSATLVAIGSMSIVAAGSGAGVAAPHAAKATASQL